MSAKRTPSEDFDRVLRGLPPERPEASPDEQEFDDALRKLIELKEGPLGALRNRLGWDESGDEASDNEP